MGTLTTDEIHRLLALKPTYWLELYGCPNMRVGVLEVAKDTTGLQALEVLAWVCEIHELIYGTEGRV
jgi:hypothetical protein